VIRLEERHLLHRKKHTRLAAGCQPKGNLGSAGSLQPDAHR
jgi:hypothetical protein